MTRPTHIYALLDPRTAECRYVGKTVDVARRIRAYRNPKANTACHCWLRGLKPLAPEFVVIDQCSDADWEEYEQFWILYLRSLGARLLNHTEGGGGIQGWVVSIEGRAKMSAARRGELNPMYGKPRTQEVKDRLRDANLGKKHSPRTEAQRTKISEALKGRKGAVKTEAQKAALSLRFAGEGNPNYRGGISKPRNLANKGKGRQPWSHTEDTKTRLRETSIARGCKPPSWIGKRHSPETLLKMSAARALYYKQKKELQNGKHCEI